MSLTTAGIGLLLTIAAVAAFIGGVLPRARVLAIIVGIIAMTTAGPGGHLFRWLDSVVGWAQSITNGIALWAFGIGVPGLFALICAAVVIFDLHPRGGRASRRTFYFAVALGVMIAAGTTNVGLLNNLGPQITHGVQTAQNGG